MTVQQKSPTKARRFRELLASGIVVSPAVFDGYSARLVEKMGYKTFSTSGAGLSNSRLGQPDIGIMSLMENVQAARNLTQITTIPMMADADTGYGNAVTVFHTVEYFEAAGVVGISIEDQVSPKRCGHMAGKEIIPAREMAKKIEAAVRARKDADFVINARTDAIAIEGLDGAIARAKLYVAAGADMVFPDAIESDEQIRRFVDAVGVPVSINMGFGIRSRPTSPLLSVRHLASLGVARVSLGRMLPAAAIMGMRRALELMTDSIETGTLHDRPDLLAGIEEITDLMGYDKIHGLEHDFMLPEDIQKRYRSDTPDYVIKEKSSNDEPQREKP